MSSALAAVAALQIGLAPLPAAPGGADIATLAVTLRFDGVANEAGKPLLRLPLAIATVDTAATAIGTVDARDDAGPLTLTSRDVDVPLAAAGDGDAGSRVREWIAGRAVSGRLTVRYSVPARETLPPRGPAPPFAFSNDGRATSAASNMFLLLPPGGTHYRTTVTWDLAGLPAGARGVSAYGVGRVSVPEPLNASDLRDGYYMVGRIGIWPEPAPARGFFSAWQGTPPFDAAALMRWTGTLYGHYARFFGQRVPPPYGVFLRYNPINAGGGVGLSHAFVATFGRAGGPGSDPAELHVTLAHEMFHTFQPYIEATGSESSWFAEGLATFYESRLPLRFGLATPGEALKDINMTAGRYYTSIMAMLPDREIPDRFWTDTRVRTLPYDRGMLYFASVDDAIRKRSGGRRSLDTLMLAMLAKSKAGKALTDMDWETELRAALGEPAVADFRAFLAGREPLPASDAFGPCFRRTTKPLRRYELGFDAAALAGQPRIVRGLDPRSAAARAGLRDGDEIVVPVSQDDIQGDQTARLRLTVRRDGRIFPIAYLPRGETVRAYQWERVAGVPDARCPL